MILHPRSLTNHVMSGIFFDKKCVRFTNECKQPDALEFQTIENLPYYVPKSFSHGLTLPCDALYI